MTKIGGGFLLTFRDGTVRTFKTMAGAMRSRRPGAVITRIADGVQVWPWVARSLTS